MSKAINKDYLLNTLKDFDDDILENKYQCKTEEMTQAEYDALSAADKNKDCFYIITESVAPGLPHIVVTKAIDLQNWTTDTTSQSGSTLYKKQISLNHVYVDCPDICIGVDPAGSTPIPSKAEQTAYDLIQYITVDKSVPCLYIYAKSIPVTAFYIKVEGVD